MMIRVVVDLQLMLLEEFLDVKVPRLYSELLVLIVLCSPPMVVQFSHWPYKTLHVDCRSLE